MSIGIIGFGRFGRLLANYLCEDFLVYVYDRDMSKVQNDDCVVSSLEQVCTKEYLILAVPISQLKALLKKIAPLVKKHTTVIDVCSVKKLPAEWMKSELDENVQVLATHPMFGPDSARESLEGKKIVLCKENIAEGTYKKVKEYLEGKGLSVIETSPDEHDRQIATTLSLVHFIGRGLGEYGAQAKTIDTEGYKRLLAILDVVEHDTWQLFEDMHKFNPYAQEAREKFFNSLKKVEERLSK
ncbi:MAG: prephenate dehydrogenase/arogenate dehydrogenase family protein [Candidatus Nanoarchaeia archaeon]